MNCRTIDQAIDQPRPPVRLTRLPRPLADRQAQREKEVCLYSGTEHLRAG